MGIIRVLLVVACLAVLGHTQDTSSLDMFGLINVLYWKADANRDGTITETELDDVWQGFDVNGDKIVTPAEFVPFWASVTGMSQELSRAYFFIADLDDNGQIDSVDLNLIYQRFDINGDGTVTAEEFNLKWQQLYREAPFGVLYLRADTNKDDDLQRTEFSHLFSSLGSHASSTGAVTKAEFSQAWGQSKFGSTSDGAAIFAGLDTDHDGTLTVAEMSALFPHYDLSHNGDVELIELLEMAKLTPTPAPST